jgi:D-sedoheptulose 7-phosphate isomerase
LSIFKENLKEHLNLFKLLEDLSSTIDHAINLCASSLLYDGKVLLCGNGGSAADCQHIASELTGRFMKDRIPINAIALTTDTSALTAISNDFSFNEVFSRQLQALGRPDDVLIAISTSGNSANVIEAAKAAKNKDIKVIGLLGNDGGKLDKLCDVSIIVPSKSTARIQEAHILIGHTICEGIEIELGLV